MAKRQRMGWWFLCLACVVVMVCTAQRMAGLHALQMDTAVTSVVASAQVQADEASPVTPCELSAKSLLAAPPVLFEGAVPAVVVAGASAGVSSTFFPTASHLAAHSPGASPILRLP